MGNTANVYLHIYAHEWLHNDLPSHLGPCMGDGSRDCECDGCRFARELEYEYGDEWEDEYERRLQAHYGGRDAEAE